MQIQISCKGRLYPRSAGLRLNVCTMSSRVLSGAQLSLRGIDTLSGEATLSNYLSPSENVSPLVEVTKSTKCMKCKVHSEHHQRDCFTTEATVSTSCLLFCTPSLFWTKTPFYKEIIFSQLSWYGRTISKKELTEFDPWKCISVSRIYNIKLFLSKQRFPSSLF